MRSRWTTVAMALLALAVTAGADSCGAADREEPVVTAAPVTAPPPVAEDTPDAGIVESQAEIVVLFSNTDDGGVRNGAVSPATLVLDRPATVTYVQTYHWNDGAGVPPGEIVIRAADGAEVGRWVATGEPGQGGVPNAYWAAEPGVSLGQGTYLVEDTDAATRSTNDAMGGVGQTIVRGFFEE